MCSSLETGFRPLPAAVGLGGACAAALVALALAGCGNKESPKPPPQMIPVRTIDLAVGQRGNELLLTFTYPTTTIAGLALGDLESVELWELVREMPLIAAPVASPVADADEGDETENGGASAGESEETATGGVTPGRSPVAARTTAPTKEDLATIEPAEFFAVAKIRLTLKKPELDDAISGSKITVRLPLEPLPEPAAGAGGAEVSAGEAGSAAPPPDATAVEPAKDEEPDAPAEPAEDAAEAAAAEGPIERVYLFAVKTVPVRGLTSAFSNLAKIVQRPPPSPPADFEAQATAGGILLSWKGDDTGETETDEAETDEAETREAETAERAVGSEGKGYRVYRRDAKARAYGEPLRVLPAGFSRYVDSTAEFGRRYIYGVTAVSVTDPVVESAIAVEHEVNYEDRFPPPSPANPIALPEAGAVRLIWDAVEDDDLRGYFVERAEGGGSFAAINEEPVTDLELTDRDVVSGRDYRYRVYAVDAVGNRGRPSEAIEVRAP